METVRLNLGAGDKPLDGYVNLDIKDGTDARDLSAWGEDSVDEVRASHLLEHFGYEETEDILTEWVRVLRPGGRLRIAVPDSMKVMKTMVAVEEGRHDEDMGKLTRFLMGGHLDEHDHHKTVFNRRGLEFIMRRAGLMGIGEWKGDGGDCSEHGVSMNLEGFKPSLAGRQLMTTGRVRVVMSMPRLSWTDNSVCCFEACQRWALPLHMHTGAYWHKTLQNTLEKFIDDTEYFITVDYDTVFTADDIDRLVMVAAENEGVDAVSCLQPMRSTGRAMMNPGGDVTPQDLDRDMLPVKSAHFGLTLLSAEALRKMPKPWFQGEPAEDGTWGEGSRDADIAFWDRWHEAGNTLFMLPRRPIGHLETVVSWCGEDLRPVYQTMNDYKANGIPREAHW